MSDKITWQDLVHDEELDEYIKYYKKVSILNEAMVNHRFHPEVFNASRDLKVLINQRIEELKERKE